MKKTVSITENEENKKQIHTYTYHRNRSSLDYSDFYDTYPERILRLRFTTPRLTQRVLKTKLLALENVVAYYKCCICSCKFKSRRIGYRYVHVGSDRKRNKNKMKESKNERKKIM
jgi:hypothetical protein